MSILKVKSGIINRNVGEVSHFISELTECRGKVTKKPITLKR